MFVGLAPSCGPQRGKGHLLYPFQPYNLLRLTLLSLVEMFVGIICACMPALARAYRHHLPYYEKLKNSVCSRFGTSRSTTNDGLKQDFALRPKRHAMEHGMLGTTISTLSQNGTYMNLESQKHSLHSSNVQSANTNSYSRESSSNGVEANEIRLNFEMGRCSN